MNENTNVGKVFNLTGGTASHNHDASDISSGELAVEHGGTGAATAEDALTNLGAAAANHTHDFVPPTRTVNGKTLNRDISLNAADVGAATADHTHDNYAASSHSHAASDITSGELPVERGGTGAATAEDALTNLGAAAANHTHDDYVPVTRTVNGKTLNADISLNAADVGAAATDHTHDNYAASSHSHAASDITSGTVAVEYGGTGAATAEDARTNLDVYSTSEVDAKIANVDVSSELFGYVPTTRTVNGKALNADVSLNAADVGAAATDHTHDNYAASSHSHAASDISSGELAVEHGGTGAATAEDALTNLGAAAANHTHDFVPPTRTVNGKALNADVTLNAADVGAATSGHTHDNYVPTTRTVNGKALNADVTLNAADVGAAASDHTHSEYAATDHTHNDYVPTTRTVNGKALSENITLSASDVGAAASSHSHSAANITSGTLDAARLPASAYNASAINAGMLPIARGGTGANTAEDARENLDVYSKSVVDEKIRNIDTSGIDMSGYVPTTRTVNGKALSENITLSASDVGAAASGHTHSEYATSSHSHSAANITSGTLDAARLPASAYNASAINAGTLPIANGGTGATTAADARTALGAAAASHTHSGYAASSHGHAATDITSGTLPVNRGGTGAATLTSGSFVQGNGTGAVVMRTPAQVLSDIGAAASSHTHSEYAASSHSHSAGDITSGTLPIARGGTNASTAAAARTNLGLTQVVYATCDTAADTAAKVATLSDSDITFTLTAGARVAVKFTHSSTAIAPTLNVNDTGAKNIRSSNAVISYKWSAGEVLDFVYDGTYWQAFKEDKLPIANGGTGANTASAAFNAIAVPAALIKIGSTATATNASYAIVMGANATVTSNYSGVYASPIAIGRSANVAGPATSSTLSANAGAIAIGSNSTSSGHNSIAFGRLSTASANNAVAIGFGAVASALNSVALGSNCTASNANSIQLGSSTVKTIYSVATSITSSSDLRDKADVTNIADGAMDFLRKIHAIRYVYNARVLYQEEEEWTDTEIETGEVDEEGNPIVEIVSTCNLSEEERSNRLKYGLGSYDKEAHAAGTKKGDRVRVGVAAQEILAALTEVYGDDSYGNLVNDNFHDIPEEERPKDVENQLGVNYTNFIPFIIKALQEIDERLSALEEK